ncbi:RDD family protein [Actinomadura sp. 1N219]|uniref:RDD family protein n=1 Tax=Actinomadura sp. 1N219 TaxID=3375152 RepID=UPI0037B09626
MHGPYSVPSPPALPPPAAEEPAAAPGRRLAAWGIDAAAVAVAAFFLGVMTWGRLNSILKDGLWDEVLGSIWGLLLSGGDIERAVEEFGASVWGSVVGAVQQALILLVLIEFAHQFAGQALAGRTLGKTVLDLRVENARPATKAKASVPLVLRRAAVTTAGGTGLYCIAWIFLLHGVFVVAVLTWMLAVAIFVANSVPALFGDRRTLADQAAGTVVRPAQSVRRAAEMARHGAGRAWAGTQSAGQAAGHAVRDQTARLNADDRMRRAMESDRARQAQERARQAQEHAQELSRRSAAKMRDAVQGERARQLQDKGKRLGGRLKNAYTVRRAAGQDPTPPPSTPPPAIPPPAPYYDPYTQPEPSTQPDSYTQREPSTQPDSYTQPGRYKQPEPYTQPGPPAQAEPQAQPGQDARRVDPYRRSDVPPSGGNNG